MVTHMLEPLRKEGKCSLSLPFPQLSPWPLLVLGSPGHRRIRPPRRFSNSPSLDAMPTLCSEKCNNEACFPEHLPTQEPGPEPRLSSPAGSVRGFLPCLKGRCPCYPIKESFHHVGQRQPPASARSFSAQNTLPPYCGHYL